MRERFDPGHVAYLAQGSDDLGTIAANRNGYRKLGLRPRRLPTSATPTCPWSSSVNA